jgi:cytidyltransferase-like protein
MLNYIKKFQDIDDELFLAVCFHDIVYDPYSNDNEERSCGLVKSFPTTTTNLNKVCELIMYTKDPFYHKDQMIVKADFKTSFDDLIQYENDIFYEFQRIPIKTYIKQRISFLKTIPSSLVEKEKIDFLIQYIQSKKYKIGIYAGSFNPYHIGHEDIVQQAEKIFDKVIIAQCINAEKDIPKRIEHKYHQTILHKSLIWDLFNEEPNIEKTLIRGLRSSFDVSYEDTLRKTILEFKDIPIMYFFCHKEFDHISSSLIRSMYGFGEDIYGRYLC